MHLPATGCGGIKFSGGLSGSCPLTTISRDALSLYLLVEGFQWNLPQRFVMWVGNAENDFEVRDQRSEVRGHDQTDQSIMAEACMSKVCHRQWRRYTRARQVKWPGWKVHRPGSSPGSALPSPAYCFALLR